MNIRVSVDWKAWIQFIKKIVEHLLCAKKRESANGREGRVGEYTKMNRTCGPFLSRDSESAMVSYTVIHFLSIRENVLNRKYIKTTKGWTRLEGVDFDL